MKVVKTKVIKPSPYYNISFGCGNRAFYDVKSELYQIGANIGIEPQDGYMDEMCDYEGDLNEIRIYSCDRAEAFIAAILQYYGVTDDVPKDMDVVLSIY